MATNCSPLESSKSSIIPSQTESVMALGVERSVMVTGLAQTREVLDGETLAYRNEKVV